MNLGIIIDFDDTPTEGGGYSYISLFINKLLAANEVCDFTIFSRFSREEIKRRYQLPENVQVFDLKGSEKIRLWILKSLTATCRILKLSPALNFFLEERQKKIYHASFVSRGIDSVLYLPYNKIYTLDLPFFYTIWDIGHRNINIFPEVSHNGRFVYREKVYQDVVPRAYKVVAETEAGKRDIEFYYRIKPQNILVAPLFAGEVVNHPYKKEEADLFFHKHKINKGEYLFYPAQFWAHKNHVNLLHAFKKLTEKDAALQLVLCGSDKNNFGVILSLIKKLQLEERVRILGFVEELKYVKALYENAWALVMPTFLGPSNMPILEAMALGCPVICSDFEGHRELGGDHLVYIQPDDPDSIVEAVESLRDSQKRKQMAEAAKEYYQNSDNHIDKSVAVLVKEFQRLQRIRRCWE